MNKPANAEPVIVLYDGSCPVCSREIAHYSRRKGALDIRWIDASKDLVNLKALGIGQQAAMDIFHVRDSSGEWRLGVEGFLLIWSSLPAYRWLAHAVSILRLRRPLAFAYRHFAVWRFRRRCGADSCSGAKTVRGH